MREIEVKARVRNGDVILANAKSKGIAFGDAISQDDTTYEIDKPHADPTWNIFRIRKQADKTILTMKYKASPRPRDNHEHETVIDNPTETAAMLERLGYKLGVRLHKHRRIAKHDGLELCFDEIDDLGTFIEVEKLATNDADVDAVQNDLWNLLLELGVDPNDRIYESYASLMEDYLKTRK